jgi:hypothetical protein
MSNLPPSMVIHNSRTGMVDVASALDMARSVAGMPASAGNAVVVPSARPPVDSVSATDLRTLFRRDASTADRGRALQSFGATAAARLRDVKTAAASGADVVAERSGQLLSEVVDHMPIRRAEDLRSEFGAAMDVLTERVIDDGVNLARWLWTASKAIPGPDLAVHAAKVVLHSAIEIRVVGELHEAHRDPDVNGAATPLSEILAAWVSGVPGGPTWSTTSVVGALVTHTHRALNELRGSDGRITGIMNRGREGGDIVRAVGEKMNDALRQRAIP